jgi:hypothetical protein
MGIVEHVPQLKPTSIANACRKKKKNNPMQFFLKLNSAKSESKQRTYGAPLVVALKPDIKSSFIRSRGGV